MTRDNFEQAVFEQAVKESKAVVTPEGFFARNAEGEYVNESCEAMWTGWKLGRMVKDDE